MVQSDVPRPPDDSALPAGEIEDRIPAGQTRGLWRLLRRVFRRPSSGIEITLEWLTQLAQKWETRSTPSPSLILSAGLAMEALTQFGYREAAWRIGRWLQERQLPDGSLSESRAPEAVFSATAAATRGWLAALPELSQFAGSAQKACVFMRQWVGEEGRLLPPRNRSWNYEASTLFDEPADLTPLLWAGRRWSDTDWTTIALRAIDYWLRHGHRRVVADQSSAIVRRALLYLDWGHHGEAQPLVEKLERRQTAAGAVPEQENGSVIFAATVAQASLLWFRMSNEWRGEQAYRFLEKRRLSEGGFPRGIRGGSENERDADPLAATYFLEATLWRVRCAYRGRIQQEEVLDSEDPRLTIVRSLVGLLPPGATVADLGCGTGRYLKFLSSWFPNYHWLGVDFVPEALQQIPRGIKTIEGNLLRIPLSDRSLHAVFSVDAVSHALLPRGAVLEMARITRPGGYILVIDRQQKTRTLGADPWEQPVTAEQVADWLRDAAQPIKVQQFGVSAGALGRTPYFAALFQRIR
ncbi:MAG: class I SAM-dependent methyltransferase [Thermogutta sp.]